MEDCFGKEEERAFFSMVANTVRIRAEGIIQKAQQLEYMETTMREGRLPEKTGVDDPAIEPSGTLDGIRNELSSLADAEGRLEKAVYNLKDLNLV